MRGLRKPDGHRLQQWLSAGFVSALSVFYLLLCPQGGYQAIWEFKYRLFLWLSLLYIGMSLLLRGELRLVSSQRGRSRPRSPGVRPGHFLLLYLLFTAVSALLSDYPGTFLGNGRKDGLLTISIYVAVFFLLRDHFRPPKWLLAVFGVCVSLFCLLGIVQLTGANPLGLYPAGHNFYGAGIYYPGQYWSTIGNVDLCASFLSLAAGLFAAACIRADVGRDRAYLVPLCLSVFSIRALNAQAGLVALLVGLVLLPPFLVTRRTHLTNLAFTYGAVLFSAAMSGAIRFYDGGAALVLGPAVWLPGLLGPLLVLAGVIGSRPRQAPSFSPKKARRRLAALSLGLILLGALVVYVHPALPAGALRQAHDLLHGHWEDSFGSGRLYIWRQTLRLIPQAPLFGGGPDTLAFRGLEGFSRYNEVLGQTVSSSIDAAHNEYLNILVNQGAPALLAYLAFLGAMARRWWSRSYDDRAALSGAAALFYLLQAFFGISMCLAAPYLWVALAILDHKSTTRKEDET